jgi:hypothetical protein
MANTQDQRVDRIAANAAAPDSEKPKVDRVVRTAGAKAPPAEPIWIRNLNDYDRKERREFQITR